MVTFQITKLHVYIFIAFELNRVKFQFLRRVVAVNFISHTSFKGLQFQKPVYTDICLRDSPISKLDRFVSMNNRSQKLLSKEVTFLAICGILHIWWICNLKELLRKIYNLKCLEEEVWKI